jgi:predicted nucleic acid-binding protein
LTLFVDTSVWFAAVVAKDVWNPNAKAILAREPDRVTTDHVLVETWQLLNARGRRDAAERLWSSVRGGIARLEFVTPVDLEAAWSIGEAFPDQDFSIVDRTSFAVMERLGVTLAASYDGHFAIYRYGRKRDRAFEVLR